MRLLPQISLTAASAGLVLAGICWADNHVLNWHSRIGAPDCDPARLGSNFWIDHGAIYNLPLLDSAGQLKIQQTKYFIATTALRKDHASDRNGEGVAHVHFRDDYVSIDDANRYWDSRFDAPRSATRIANATNRTNGGAHTVALLSANSQTEYWVDENMNAFPQLIDSIFDATSTSATPAARPQEASESTNGHGQVGDLQTVVELKWKVGVSGEYRSMQRSFKKERIKQIQVR